MIFQQLSVATTTERDWLWFFNNFLSLLLLKEFGFSTFYNYYGKSLTLIFQQHSITTTTESVEPFLVVLLLKYDWLFVITTTLRMSFWTTFYCAFCYYYYTSTEFLNNVLFVLLLLLEFNYFFLTTLSYYFVWLFNYSLFSGLGQFFRTTVL